MSTPASVTRNFHLEQLPVEAISLETARLRQREAELEALRNRLGLIDEAFPAMLAYVDTAERYRFHNRAYREWLGLTAQQIDGRSMREVLGESVYAEIAAPLRDALAGQARRYERTQRTRDGGTARIFAYLIPRFDEGQRILGLYALLVDETELNSPCERASNAVGNQQAAAPPEDDASENFQALYDDSLVGELTEWKDAADRIRLAIQRDEFRLYAQTVRPLLDGRCPLREIYVRLAEEEENLMPPGAFLPLAEQHGLMPDIDRWVVTNVLKHAAEDRRSGEASRLIGHCVNLSVDSVRDPYFPDFVRAKLTLFDLPGDVLLFEIEERDADANLADCARLVQELARLGCASVLCSFGHDKVSFDLLKELRVGYLKIDSSIILQILRDKSALAKLTAINRVAHTIGISTIAEFVESDEILAAVRKIGIDYAQGLGIATPRPLQAIE